MKNFPIKILNICLLTFSLVASSQAVEKVGTTSFQFLKVLTDARATAMGEAYTAVTDNSDAVFWNPGALTKVTGTDFNFSYMDYFLDVNHFSFAGAYNLSGIGTIGIQGIFVDVGEMQVTRVSDLRFIGETYNPGLTGETFSPSAFVFGLSFAKSLTEKFSFGLTAKYIREDMDIKSASYGDINASAIAFDAGLVYRTGFKSVEISAVVRHFGPEVTYVGQGYPLPQTFNIGISGYLMGKDENMFMNSENQSLLIAADLIQPRDYDQQYNIGLEYSLMDMLFLRGGYKINYDSEGLAAGFGLKFKNYRIDYSFNDYGDYLDSVHRFSIGFKID
jgi:hypothetical protein